MDDLEGVKKLTLYAWIGVDEFGDEVGIKCGLSRLGLIPLVSCTKGHLSTEQTQEQMQAQADHFDRTIRLVRFTF